MNQIFVQAYKTNLEYPFQYTAFQDVMFLIFRLFEWLNSLIVLQLIHGSLSLSKIL